MCELVSAQAQAVFLVQDGICVANVHVDVWSV